jgi:hypothetical protein
MELGRGDVRVASDAAGCAIETGVIDALLIEFNKASPLRPTGVWLVGTSHGVALDGNNCRTGVFLKFETSKLNDVRTYGTIFIPDQVLDVDPDRVRLEVSSLMTQTDRLHREGVLVDGENLSIPCGREETCVIATTGTRDYGIEKIASTYGPPLIGLIVGVAAGAMLYRHRVLHRFDLKSSSGHPANDNHHGYIADHAERVQARRKEFGRAWFVKFGLNKMRDLMDGATSRQRTSELQENEARSSHVRPEDDSAARSSESSRPR